MRKKRNQPKVPVLVEVGQRLQEQRRRLGFSQEELAHRAGLHRTFIGFVERGERSITVVNLLRLCTALEVEAGAVLKGIKVDRKDV